MLVLAPAARRGRGAAARRPVSRRARGARRGAARAGGAARGAPRAGPWRTSSSSRSSRTSPSRWPAPASSCATRARSADHRPLVAAARGRACSTSGRSPGTSRSWRSSARTCSRRSRPGSWVACSAARRGCTSSRSPGSRSASGRSPPERCSCGAGWRCRACARRRAPWTSWCSRSSSRRWGSAST